jgi:hypothetical protein
MQINIMVEIKRLLLKVSKYMESGINNFKALSIQDKILGIIFTLIFFVFVLPVKWVLKDNDYLQDAFPFLMNYAYQKHYIFGIDFIYTYGPFSFLSTAVPLPGTTFLVILFKLLFLFFYFFTLLNFFIKFSSIIFRITFLSFIIFFGRIYLIDITLFSLILFSLWLTISRNFGKSEIILASIIISIFFYIKLHTAFAFLIVFWVLILSLIFNHKLPKGYLFFIGLPLFFIVLFSLFVPVQFPEYIQAALYMIKGNNDAMFLEVPSSRSLYASLLILLMMLLPFLLNYRSISMKNIGSIFIFLITLFIAFKQGYTRADEHQLIFLGTIPLFIIMGMQITSNRLMLLPYLSSFSIFLCFFCAHNSGILYRPVVANYFRTTQENKVPPGLPLGVREKIGKSTVDLFPGNISIIFTNFLNYKPRPVPQSYAVSNVKLDGKNINFFMQEDAPKFLLYKNGSIDDRHPFWDESNTKITLLSQYKTVSLFPMDSNPYSKMADSMFLLERMSIHKYTKTKIILDTTISMGDSIAIPNSNNLILMFADIEYSNLNKIRHLIFHPRFATVTLSYTDNSKSVHRAIPQIMKGGVITNFKLLSNQAAYHLFDGAYDSIIRTRMVYFKANDLWFNPKIKIRLMELKLF